MRQQRVTSHLQRTCSIHARSNLQEPFCGQHMQLTLFQEEVAWSCVCQMASSWDIYMTTSPLCHLAMDHGWEIIIMWNTTASRLCIIMIDI